MGISNFAVFTSKLTFQKRVTSAVFNIGHIVSPGRTQKSGGKPTFLTLRLRDLHDCFHVESLSGGDQNLNADRLKVRKAGLPPLCLLSYFAFSCFAC